MTRHAPQRSTATPDEFQSLPGIGPSMAADLRLLGVRGLRDLARRDPQVLYDRLCELTRTRQDPCVLYVFRCAVYASRTRNPEPELLKWWSWKGRPLPRRRARRRA